MRKKVVITGSVSLIGRYLIHKLNPQYEIFAGHHGHVPNEYIQLPINLIPMEISDEVQMNLVLGALKPDTIIHLAAISNIDACEKEPQEARRINTEATKSITNIAQKANAQLIFLSSNAVFSGDRPPYSEEAKTNPLNQYGKTKADAEQIVSGYKNSTIIRSTTVYGWPPQYGRDNDLTYYLKLIKTGQTLPLVTDRYFNPIDAHTLSQAIIETIRKSQTGIFHIAGSESINRYEFVKKIADFFDVNKNLNIIPVHSDHFKTLAPRPHDATLSTKKMENILKVKPPSIYEGLTFINSSTLAPVVS